MNDPELCFVTTNAGKLREAQDILQRPVTGVALSLEELQTTDMEVLVRHKAAQAYGQLNRPLFVEDTALIFQAWGALPGPFVKYFLEHLGLEGLVRALKPFGNMAAKVVCGVGYHDGASVHYVEGRAEGIITEPAGSGGFGFDPIFRPDEQPTGTARTYAEMDPGEKSLCSMRAQALRRLEQLLAGH